MTHPKKMEIFLHLINLSLGTVAEFHKVGGWVQLLTPVIPAL